MFTLIVRERDGEERRELFDEEQVVVGRVPGNDLVLRAGNVSRQHARFMYRDGRLIVADLGSANGTYVNGRKIRHGTILRSGDEVWMGDFCMRVELASPGVLPVDDADAADVPVRWYVYREGGQSVGPVTSEQVCNGIRAGKVPLDSFVCPAAGGDWLPIEQVVDFVGAVRTVTDSLASRQGAVPVPCATEVPSTLQSDAGPEALWYMLADDDRPFGPVTTDQVRCAIRSGQLPTGAKVNQAGSPDWHELASCPEFQDEVLRKVR
ncbi:MAG: GYF domain-containing protein [Polyangiaceae bacterium]|jgi:hypothetical protein|nr:GYF domain-containing protein [Polyangiaceae bacterium]